MCKPTAELKAGADLNPECWNNVSIPEVDNPKRENKAVKAENVGIGIDNNADMED